MVNSRNGPVLLTNRHVVTLRSPGWWRALTKGGPPDEIAVIHNRKDQLGSWVQRVEPLFTAGQPRWIEHPTLKDKADVVALPLTQLDDVALYPYDVTNSADISIGPADTVSVIGFPFGITAGGGLAVWSTGFVASELDIDFDDMPVFLIDCRSRPGQSGSPVIAYRTASAPTASAAITIFGRPTYRFLGIYSGRINAESDLGRVWKASAIRELIGAIPA